jgi:hypothetical protein
MLGIRHLDKAEAAWLTSVTVEHDRYCLDLSIGTESSSKLIFSHSKIQVTNEDIDHRIVSEAYLGGDHVVASTLKTRQDERFLPASPWDPWSRQIARFGPLAGF